MNLRNKSKFRPEVSTSALSDIMFFLMLFFLIVSTMVTPGAIKMTLPKAKTDQNSRNASIAISVTKEKQYYLNNTPVTLESLEAELGKLLGGREDEVVLVKMDNSLTVQDLVDLLQIGSRLRVKMSLSTKVG
ncbi:MAG: biopolymer transporter ExbD [Breznakibacter sp.]